MNFQNFLGIPTYTEHWRHRTCRAPEFLVGKDSIQLLPPTFQLLYALYSRRRRLCGTRRHHSL